MNNEELQQKVERLERAIDWIKTKLVNLQEEKGLTPVKTPYEVEVPEDIGNYYFVSECGAITLLKDVFFSVDYEKVYQRGLAFKTKKEAKQYDKERILLFKLHKWAEEHNEGWYPNWEGSDDKFYIYYFHNTESFCVGSDWNCNTFNKLPYFKSEELVREFIEVFGEEIKEVLC